MIQANELRIGNWVKNIELHHQNPYQVDGYHIYQVENGEIEFNPITLTPEILEKCGFVKPEDDAYQKGNMYVISDRFVQLAIGTAPLYNCPCEYLHQLQNLYFALTGNELQYTPLC